MEYYKIILDSLNIFYIIIRNFTIFDRVYTKLSDAV